MDTSQIQGVDFSENYPFVVNDITYRILISLMLTYGYDMKIVDVETSFLYGDLEEIYVECSSGMTKKDKFLS